MSALHETARALVAPAKGILAADESTGTIGKRFDWIGVASTDETRRRYRQLLFSTPGLGEHISGVILYDETIRQADQRRHAVRDGARTVGRDPGDQSGHRRQAARSLPRRNGHRRARRDAGTPRRVSRPGRKIREMARHDNHRRRVAPAFARIANGHAMARYAALCQEAGIVPIVEPEILMDGDHDLAACEAATADTLDALYAQMAHHRVDLAGTLLKVNMVVPGTGSAIQDDDATIAAATIRTLSSHVPADVPGVVFLSGGMSDEQATSRLQEMHHQGGLEATAQALSFSYGRALQAPSLRAWGGEAPNVGAARRRWRTGPA